MCSIFLIKPQRYKPVMFAAKYQLKRFTVAILNCMSFHSLCCHTNRKGKPFKQCFYRNNKFFAVSTVTTCSRMLSFGTDTTTPSFCHSFIALLMIRCSKSAQKSAGQVCQVATVVMATTQLIQGQFKNFLPYSMENSICSLCAKNN